MAARLPNLVRTARQERRLTQGALAEAAGVSRQSLGAIESGRSEPSVSVALGLARALDRRVEDLFGASDEPGVLTAELAGGHGGTAGTRVVLARIRDRWVAHALGRARPDAAQTADGVVVREARTTSVKVAPLRPPVEARDNVVLVGCAPAQGLLADRLNRTSGPGRFVWLQHPSGAALDCLGNHQAHVAGVHLRDDAAAGAAVRRFLPGARFRLVTLARWEAGLVVRAGNPLGIRGIPDLRRPGIRIVKRQDDAGAQQLLVQRLEAAGLDPRRTLRGSPCATGHLEAAFAVDVGAADVALAMRHAALAYDLDFLPIAEERFDLVLAHDAATDPRLVRLFEVLNSASFRRELSSLGGYDAAECGRTVTEGRAA